MSASHRRSFHIENGRLISKHAPGLSHVAFSVNHPLLPAEVGTQRWMKSRPPHTVGHSPGSAIHWVSLSLGFPALGFAVLGFLFSPSGFSPAGFRPFGFRPFRERVWAMGARPAIPVEEPVACPDWVYVNRNLVERLSNRLKEWRAVATATRRPHAPSMGVLCLAAAFDWIKT